MPYVVFDLVGTCFSYSTALECLTARLGPKLLLHNITPRHLLYTIMAAAERDYSYLSQTHQYRPFTTVIRASFYRNLWFAGIESPMDFASPDDVDALLDAWTRLVPRPGLAEMIETLRSAGVSVYAATDAGAERVKRYFDTSGIAFPMDCILSGDDVGAGKPERKFYDAAIRKFGRDGEEVGYFAAAHSWDTSAAKQAGFKTVFCTVYEKYPLEELFGTPDFVVDDLVGIAAAIVGDIEK